MLDPAKLKEIIVNNKASEIVFRWQRIYYGMSLHIDGVVPFFWCLKDPSIGWQANNIQRIYPTRWGGLDYQYIFEYSLMTRHPREPVELMWWRFSQYRPWAKSAFAQAIQVITGALFQDAVYTIQIENQKDNDYIWGTNFDGKDLIGYITAQFQNIAEDPNGFFIVRPKMSRQEYISQGGEIEPEIIFIHTKYLLWQTDDELIYNIDGTFWLIDRIGHYRFKLDEQGNIINIDGVNDGYYMHGMGEMPVIVAGGLWNSQGYYDSWLDAAKAVADEYVQTKSSEQMAWKESSHPFIEEMSAECPECNSGDIQWCNNCECNSSKCQCNNPTRWSIHKCSACQGTGNISHNPGQRMLIPYEQMDKPGIRITAPPIDIPVAHSTNNEKLLLSILKSLHLNYVEQAQSGVAKDRDMETRYQFFSRMSNDLFDRVLNQFIKYISAYRNVTVNNGLVYPKPSAYIIVKPTQFQIKTAGDLLEDYDKSTKSAMPSFVRAEQVCEFVDRQWGGNDVMKKKTYFIKYYDSLFVVSTSDISVMLVNGSIDQRAAQLHNVLPNILDEIIIEQSPEWFKSAKIEAIETMVEAKFNEIYQPPIALPNEIVRANV